MDDVKAILQDYLREFPDETLRQQKFSDFLSACDPTEYCNRKNFRGHITASALIVSHSTGEVLLLHQTALTMWLQPGGHVKLSDGSLVEAALRETQEETGIDIAALSPISRHLRHVVPLDIDTHPIPERQEKNEKKHCHFDFRYLFVYRGTQKPIINKREASEFKWVRYTELTELPSLVPVVDKMRHALSVEFRTKQFYDALIRSRGDSGPSARAIVVCHMIPDCMDYLKAINELFPIAAIIPKPNSIDQPTMDYVESQFPIADVKRDEIRKSDNRLLKILGEFNDEVILFDIGGYFANAHTDWPKSIQSRIKLVIEDTENGHQKYASTTGRPYGVISVARSPLKENEDFLVGQSVLFSADALLRDAGILLQYLKCSVFGYGKVGRSIAFHLLQRGIKPSVYDIDHIRRLEAHNHLCSIPSREEILCSSDVIFCATGSRCVNAEDFQKLKHGCVVFSVTSSDDEMDLESLADYESSEVRDYLYKYSNDRNFFYLANRGNAVNFIHNACMGNFIHLVRGEMLAATWEPLGNLTGTEIKEVSRNTRNSIAEKWLEVFDPEHRRISVLELIR